MILYISNATEYSIFDRLYKEGKIHNSFQMQKFNNNIISGLSYYADVVSLSILPYSDVHSERIDTVINGVRYISPVFNAGKKYRLRRKLDFFREGRRIVREQRITCIICDAIATYPCYLSVVLSKLYNIPSIGIITDLPGFMGNRKDPALGAERMHRFDGYVLLTEQMNGIVNPKDKPYIVMEGLCPPVIPPLFENKSCLKTVLYTGSLWKKDAGIEYFTEGFIKAAIPDCELHFYGVGELVPWIKDISKVHPNIKYMGSVTNKEITEKQGNATLLVNPRPTNEEFCKYSFPSKTIEYMASGTPVMMTKLPGVPQEYFDYVYPIEQEDSEGVCRSLKSFFSESNEDRRMKGLSARKFVSECKNCDAQIQKILKFAYESLGVKE